MLHVRAPSPSPLACCILSSLVPQQPFISVFFLTVFFGASCRTPRGFEALQRIYARLPETTLETLCRKKLNKSRTLDWVLLRELANLGIVELEHGFVIPECATGTAQEQADYETLYFDNARPSDSGAPTKRARRSSPTLQADET